MPTRQELLDFDERIRRLEAQGEAIRERAREEIRREIGLELASRGAELLREFRQFAERLSGDVRMADAIVNNLCDRKKIGQVLADEPDHVRYTLRGASAFTECALGIVMKYAGELCPDGVPLDA